MIALEFKVDKDEAEDALRTAAGVMQLADAACPTGASGPSNLIQHR